MPQTQEKPLSLGDKAPSFQLTDQEGKLISLDSLLGSGPLVVYFYPKDDTPGCTKESCAFRDSYEDFKSAGATVIGISSDSSASHKAFAERHRLPFILLADSGGKVRKSWSVPNSLGFIPGRVTYILDKDGIVRHIFNSQFNALQHVDEALAVIKKLQ